VSIKKIKIALYRKPSLAYDSRVVSALPAWPPRARGNRVSGCATDAALERIG
jgi:hypothetical protein